MKVDFHPWLDCFVTEDVALVKALAAANLPELRHLSIDTSDKIVAAHVSHF